MQTSESFYLVAGEAVPRLVLKPRDRTRTAPKDKRAAGHPSYEHTRKPSATKSGPGRYHRDGATKASPIKSKGAPPGFVVHQASLGKRNRKACIKALGGIRQFKRQEYANRDNEFAA